MWKTVDPLAKGIHVRSVEFESDTYFQFMLRFVQYIDVTSQCNFLTFFHALLAYVMSMFMEIIMTYFLFLGTDELDWEEAFYNAHNMTTRDLADLLMEVVKKDLPVAAIPPTVADACKTQLHICVEIAPSLMVGIWVMFVINELKGTIWIAIHLVGVDRRFCSADDDSVTLPEGHPVRGTMFKYLAETGLDPDCVQRLRPYVVAILIAAVPLLRFWIAMIVTYCGIKFIIFQTDPVKMVLKSVCMRFVFTIDELFIKSISTKGSRDILRRATLMTSLPKPLGTSWWETGAGGMVLSIATVIGSYVATHVMFSDITQLRSACFAYHFKYTVPGVQAFPSLGSMLERVTDFI